LAEAFAPRRGSGGGRRVSIAPALPSQSGWNRLARRTFSTSPNTEADMPKRIIDEKTGSALTAKNKIKRMRDQQGASSDPVDDDKTEPKGLDEDLANPELEIDGEDDEEASISPPPLDGRFAKL
jgi:hypothetical protein